MKMPLSLSIAAAVAIATIPAQSLAAGGELPAYLQCVPYAREATGILIYGDADGWWDKAEGSYRRGSLPKVGAVMSFRPHGNSTLGHVAAVTRLVDARTVLISHANWSPIDGVRGQVEENVRAVDVSPDNDWSEVRVWFAPTQALGSTHWPLNGFIYPDKAALRRSANQWAPPKASAMAPTGVAAPARPAPDASAEPEVRKIAFGDDPIAAIIRASAGKRR